MKHQSISIRQIPMISVVLTFGIGIIGNRYLDISFSYLLWLSLIIVISLLGFSNKRFKWSWRGPAVFLLLILTGGLHSSFQKSSNKKNTIPTSLIDHSQMYRAEVINSSTSANYHNILVTIKELESKHFGLIKSHGQYALLKVKRGKINLRLSPGNIITTSTRLKSTATLGSPSNDYYSFLEKKGIQYICYPSIDKIKINNTNNYAAWKYIRYDVRAKALHIISNSNLSITSKSILKALLLGYKNDIDHDTKQSFIDSGIIHILAVSGLHVGIIAYLLFVLAGRIFPWANKFSIYRIALVIIGLLLFSEISGSAPPVWRATIMTIAYLIGRSYSYQSHPLNSVGLAAIVLILHDYRCIYEVSFQLSFLAVCGIILIYPMLERLYQPKRPIAKYLVGILYMGIAAQVAITPLSLYYFNQVSILSPITSLVAIPSAFLIIIGGLSLIAISWTSPAITNVITGFIDYIITLLKSYSDIMGDLSFSRLGHIYITNIEAVIIILAFFLCIYAYYMRSNQPFKVALSLLLLQGIYHSSLQIRHSNCVHVVYDDKKHIREIYLGLTSYVFTESPYVDFNQEEERKAHHINKIINVTKVAPNHKIDLNKVAI